MRKPNPVDPLWATELLDIVTRPWNHAADGLFAALSSLVKRQVPLAHAENQLPLPHPILRSGRASWTPESGGVWLLDTDNARLEETPAERAHAGSPLRSGTASTRRCLLDGLDAELLSTLAHNDHVLEAPLPVVVQGFSDAVLMTADYEGSSRALFLFATHAPGGFSSTMLNDIQTVVWAFTALARGNRWRGIAHTIATTYVGPTTGRRVLEGKMRLGEVERRDAVVWFSDLRGFTAMSMTLTPEMVVARINVMFECVAGAIHDAGGEVLKLIGDAVLAIFPYADENGAKDATEKALQAASQLGTLPLGLSVGIGLHRGEVAYGNVGAPDRLDFTVIGRTVNLASRIESMTGHLGAPLLASHDIAVLAPLQFRSLGHHPLKGIDEPVELFAWQR
jgi:adenylate cyclase